MATNCRGFNNHAENNSEMEKISCKSHLKIARLDRKYVKKKQTFVLKYKLILQVGWFGSLICEYVD